MLHLFATIQSMFLGAKSRLTNEEKGATMVEYGLMVALIAVIVAVALVTLGPAIAGLFTSVETSL